MVLGQQNEMILSDREPIKDFRVQLKSALCECEHHLHPSGTVDETINLSESHHTTALLKEMGESGRQIGSGRLKG